MLTMTACSDNTTAQNTTAQTTTETSATTADNTTSAQTTVSENTTTAATTVTASPTSPQESATTQNITTTTEKTAAPVTTKAVTTTTERTTAATTTTVSTTTAEEKYIAFTFDDGPNTTTTVQVLDLLEKYGVVASFFLVGNNITDATAPVVKRAYDMGCEIDNHSQSHSYMNTMTADEITAEINFTNQKIYDIIGKMPCFFRPPYIAVNSTMYEAIDLPFICGKGCNDWDASVTTERRINSVTRFTKNGLIVLLHDAQGNNQTVEALDTLIPQLLADGYHFVTVTQLFEQFDITPVQDGRIYSNVFQTGEY